MFAVIAVAVAVAVAILLLLRRNEETAANVLTVWLRLLIVVYRCLQMRLPTFDFVHLRDLAGPLARRRPI